MIVALHEAPKGFFKTDPPHGEDELVSLVRKAASLGFRAMEIGPLYIFASIDGKALGKVLDRLSMERAVHVGGLFDASKFASTEEEYARMEAQVHNGIALSNDARSKLVSIHPPFFALGTEASQELVSKAKERFLKLVKEEVDFAYHYDIKLALESFCYYPFIFQNIHDFAQFVFNFPPEKLGVLLDIGHLYQVGISLSEAINIFKDRLEDLHVHDATMEKDVRKATHLPIGKGTIDFPNLVKLLREVHYDGWLTLEIRGTEKEITESKERLEILINAT